jgi:hypothetical protein
LAATVATAALSIGVGEALNKQKTFINAMFFRKTGLRGDIRWGRRGGAGSNRVSVSKVATRNRTPTGTHLAVCGSADIVWDRVLCIALNVYMEGRDGNAERRRAGRQTDRQKTGLCEESRSSRHAAFSWRVTGQIPAESRLWNMEHDTK